jgi:hypothetical protein
LEKREREREREKALRLDRKGRKGEKRRGKELRSERVD